MTSRCIIFCICSFVSTFWSKCIFAQSNNNYNPILIGAPFLQIAPDPRANGLGGTGAATSPDVNSGYWNIAKLAFLQTDSLKQHFVGINIKPLTTDLSTRINNYNATYIYKINEFSAFNAQLTYFSMGNITFADNQGNITGMYNPNEFAASVGYARAFDENFSLGMSIKYVISELNSAEEGFSNNVMGTGTALVSDVGFYYRNVFDNQAVFAAGTSISNLGTKLQFNDFSTTPQFLPTILRLGAAYTWQPDDLDVFQVSMDVTKLLVPTPPIYSNTSPKRIVKGMNSQVSVPQGVVQSFYDAPNGWREELAEIQYHLGLEWTIDQSVALRLGFQHQSRQKGSNRYATIGLGYQLMGFEMNVAYLYGFDQISQSAKNSTLSAGVNIFF